MLGDLSQEIDYHDRALSIRMKKLGPEHVYVASWVVYTKSWGDLSQAKDYLDRALAVRLNKLGPERVDVVNSYNNLGSVHNTCAIVHWPFV